MGDQQSYFLIHLLLDPLKSLRNGCNRLHHVQCNSGFTWCTALCAGLLPVRQQAMYRTLINRPLATHCTAPLKGFNAHALSPLICLCNLLMYLVDCLVSLIGCWASVALNVLLAAHNPIGTSMCNSYPLMCPLP